MSDITHKTYRKLALRVGNDGFSFAVTDTLSRQVTSFERISFPASSALGSPHKTEGHYWDSFVRYPELTRPYDEVIVLHNNTLNTFVPEPLFDEEAAAGYLQYGTRVFASDTFAHDLLQPQGMVNVYIPYANINNYLLDQFESFEYRHTASVLVPKLLELSKNDYRKQVFAHFSDSVVEILVAQNGQLIFYNAFDFVSAEDFLYYLLFTAEQLWLNPEEFPLQMLGEVSETSPLFAIAYRYVRNVSLLDTSDTANLTGVDPEAARRHFILFHA